MNIQSWWYAAMILSSILSRKKITKLGKCLSRFWKCLWFCELNFGEQRFAQWIDYNYDPQLQLKAVVEREKCWTKSHWKKTEKVILNYCCFKHLLLSNSKVLKHKSMNKGKKIAVIFWKNQWPERKKKLQKKELFFLTFSGLECLCYFIMHYFLLFSVSLKILFFTIWLLQIFFSRYSAKTSAYRHTTITPTNGVGFLTFISGM